MCIEHGHGNLQQTVAQSVINEILEDCTGGFQAHPKDTFSQPTGAQSVIYET